MFSLVTAYAICILYSTLLIHVGAENHPTYLHQPMTNFRQLNLRQREGGIFRSKWFGYREYYKAPASKDGSSSNKDSNGEEFGAKDRICIRFNPNRTINLYSKRIRPLIQMGELYLCGFGYGADLHHYMSVKKSTENQEKQRQARRLTKPSTTKQSNKPERSHEEILEELEIKKLLERDQLYNVDGTFFTDIDTSKWMRLKADLREYDQDGHEIRTRFESSFQMGKVDPISQKFALGTVYKYPDKRDSLRRVGVYLAGIISITANPHRPVIGKEFVAFQ